MVKKLYCGFVIMPLYKTKNLARVYYCYQSIIVPLNQTCRVRTIQVKCHVEGKQVFGKKENAKQTRLSELPSKTIVNSNGWV